jgi:hypothetical protein
MRERWPLLLAAAAVGCTIAAVRRFRRRRRQESCCSGLHSVPRETRLAELTTLSRITGCKILAKCEHLQPGGSIKDRASHALIDEAVASGELQPGGTIVQGTGGNTGISLAMISQARGYKCHLTIPENISPDKIELLRLLGAEVTVCPCVPFKDPKSYMSMAATIASATPGSAKPCQFENVANAVCLAQNPEERRRLARPTATLLPPPCCASAGRALSHDGTGAVAAGRRATRRLCLRGRDWRHDRGRLALP